MRLVLFVWRMLFSCFVWLLLPLALRAQAVVTGMVMANGQPLPYASVQLSGTAAGSLCDSLGHYRLSVAHPGRYILRASATGYFSSIMHINLQQEQCLRVNLVLQLVPAALQEVVVTGVSHNTLLRKSPVPIVVVRREQMDMVVQGNLIDAVAKTVPGVSAVTTGPNISKPFIRGLGYNRVLTLYDGVRQEGQQWGDEHGIEIDPSAIDRIEVVKGPASLVYGSDALAGVVNMIPLLPHTPEGRLKGEVSAEYQTNNGLAGLSAAWHYHHGHWQYLARVSGKTAHDYRNPVDGYVYATGYREYHVAAMAALEQQWGTVKWGLTVYNNLQEIPDGSRDSLTRQFTRQVAEADADLVTGRPLVPKGELSSYRIVPLHQHIQHYRLYNANTFRLGNGSLSTLVALQQSIRREYNHPTLPQQAGLYVVLNTLTGEVKYHLPEWKGLETSIGLNGMYQDNKSKAATDFPIPDYHLYDAGLFLFVKKSWGRLDVSGGIRYDRRSLTWKDFYVGTHAATGFPAHVLPPDTAGALLQFPAFSRVYQGVSGSLGFTYNLNEHVLLKANVARGYRAPNITEVGSNGLDPGAHIVYLGNRHFKPEFSWQQDIGVLLTGKEWDFGLELFHNAIRQYIYQARLYDASGNPVVIVPGNTTYAYQQSAARLYGTELYLNYKPLLLPGFSWSNSLAYTEGLNRNEALENKYGKLARYLPFIPSLHTRSALQYLAPHRAHRLADQFFLHLAVDGYAAQQHFYGVDNTETATPGYVLLSAGAGTSLVNKAGRIICRLSLQVDNLLNKAYQSNLSRLKYFEYYTASPTGKTGIYNMGRNGSLKLTVPF